MEIVMYATIEASGSQHRVSEGDVIELDRLSADENATITFDKVLLVGGDDAKIGQPYVEGATVSATVVNHFRGEVRCFQIQASSALPQKHRFPR